MRISDWSSDVCSSDLRSELVEAALVAVDIDRARFRITPFPIETPKRLHEFVPPGSVCFTTLVNEWNDEKVRRLNEQGFPTETLGLSVPDNMRVTRSEEHTSELQSLMRISYDVFCLKKKIINKKKDKQKDRT